MRCNACDLPKLGNICDQKIYRESPFKKFIKVKGNCPSVFNPKILSK